MSSLLARRAAMLAGATAFTSADRLVPLELKDNAPDTKSIMDSIDRVGRTFEEFKRTNEQEIAELKKRGASDPLTTEKLSRIEGDLKSLSEAKDKLQGLADEHGGMVKRIDGLEASLKRVGPGAGGSDNPEAKSAEEFYRAAAMLQGHKFDEKSELDMETFRQYEPALKRYLRSGGDDPRTGSNLSPEDRKALSTGTLADGGYMLTPALSNRVIQTIRETSPLRAVATIETIGTDTLEFLVDQGEAGMGWVGETASRPETTTPQLAKRSIVTGEQYANPAITQKLLDDATMDPAAWLAGKVADKFGRTEATAFVQGDGINKPRGFMNYAAGTGLNQIPRILIGPVGASPSINPDLLIDMVFQLKDPYASRGAWLANRFLMPMIMKLKDGNGQYLWQPGLQAGAPTTLLGRPLRFAADMAVPGVGSESIAFGDWGAAYTIVDRIGIRTLRDPYTNKPYVHFYSTRRVGGAVVDFEALLVGKFGAAA